MNEDGKGRARYLAGLSHFLASQHGVEALRVDVEGRKVQVATLGEVEVEELSARLQTVLEEIGREHGWTAGSLHAGVLHKPLGREDLLEKPSCPTAPRFWHWRELPWLEEAEPEEAEDFRLLGILAGLCGVFLASGCGCGVAGAPEWLVRVFYGLAMVCGGWDAAKDVAGSIWKGKVDVHFLMLAVALGAASIGAWGEGALLLFLFSGSSALEAFAHHRTRQEIHALFAAAPKTARVVREDGREEEVAVELLQPGMRVRLMPGDTVPADAVVLEGKTALDESNLTGESHPVSRGPGDMVSAGTANLWGSALVRVAKPVQESSLNKIIRLIRDAQHLKAPAQRFTDKFGSFYSLGILGGVAVLFFVWWKGMGVPAFVAGEGQTSAFYRAMTVLVVASPCALVLSIPSAILAAIAWGARHGVLFRGGAAVEKLAEVDTVALDKTGTLTTGELELLEIRSLPPGREQEVATLAYSIERHSEHPVARALVAYGRREGLPSLEIGDFQAMAGQGARARSGESELVIGRRELVARGGLAELIAQVPEAPAGTTEIWLVHRGVLGRILMRDRLRAESRPVLERLHGMGLKTLMLTGDREEVAKSVGREVGLGDGDVRGGLSPAGKVEAIRQLAKAGSRVAMVGDGVNDAPCLAAAYVSVGMGARGSDAALEQCEVVLMRDRIENFLHAYALSRRARAVIRQNVGLALGTVVVMVLAAVGGWVPLSVGVLAHEGSTVLVCLNSMRLLWTRE